MTHWIKSLLELGRKMRGRADDDFKDLLLADLGLKH